MTRDELRQTFENLALSMDANANEIEARAAAEGIYTLGETVAQIRQQASDARANAAALAEEDDSGIVGGGITVFDPDDRP